ncbi:MAG: flagellar basal body P-ring protein FlgI [Planctomycetaceae bacterium]|nr:flagellar basal body P-ring protein FlgI [Planctomycetaceae bacterium]
MSDKLLPGKKEKDPLFEDTFETETEDGKPKLVGDHVSIGNYMSIPVHGFGLVVRLPGTGGEDVNTPHYKQVYDRLNRDKITGIRALLARPDTAVVEIRGQMRPGIQRGDQFDVQILLPDNTNTRSLRGGILQPTNLSEIVPFGSELGVGATRAIVAGPIMVDDPMATDMSESEGLKRGTILSGAVTAESRALSLIMKEKSFIGVDRIARAINDRFPLNTGPRTGVASAETSSLIILNVHPSYANDIDRYIRVVQSIACFETAERQRQRIERLKEELLNPNTSQHAAFQLEAIGRRGVDALLLGLQSPIMEVRFHAATSLAYLDNGASAKVLAEIAQVEPAFRVYALNGLSVMKNDLEAEFHLRQLLHVPCEETRYGAFRALKNRNPLDLTIRGEVLGGYFSYHVIPSPQAPPMVHFTTQKLPEIVLFGSDVFVKQPFVFDAGPTIFVNGQTPGSVAVTQFAKSGLDERREVSPRLDEIIRAVVELGGSYPDVVQMLRQADMSGMLSCPLEMDRLPEPNRIYRRETGEYTADEEEEKSQSFWGRMHPRNMIPSGLSNIFTPNPGETSSDFMGTVNRSSRD